jgi:hypothetical protein
VCQEFASSHPCLRFRITLLLKSLLLLIPLYGSTLLYLVSRVCFLSFLFKFPHYSLAQEFASSHPSLHLCIITLLLKSLLLFISLYVSALLLSCSRVCFVSSLFTFPRYFLAQEFASSHPSRVCFVSSLFTFPHYSLAQEFASSHPSLRFRIILLQSLCNTPPTKAAPPNPSVGASTHTQHLSYTFVLASCRRVNPRVLWLVDKGL